MLLLIICLWLLLIWIIWLGLWLHTIIEWILISWLHCRVSITRSRLITRKLWWLWIIIEWISWMIGLHKVCLLWRLLHEVCLINIILLWIHSHLKVWIGTTTNCASSTGNSKSWILVIIWRLWTVVSLFKALIYWSVKLTWCRCSFACCGHLFDDCRNFSLCILYLTFKEYYLSIIMCDKLEGHFSYKSLGEIRESLK